MSWHKGPFKTLGVWLTNNNGEMFNSNFRDKLSHIKHILNIWSNQSLSLKGKVTIIKSLVISKIVNICSMIYVPTDFIKEVDQLLFTFV